MKIYVIASADNMETLNKTLVKDYPKIQLLGSNDLVAGIDHVIRTHITNEYDLFIIMNQSFVSIDLGMKKALSDKLNKACIYALKDLPIYFMVNSTNENYFNALKASLTGDNVNLYPYKAMQVKDIEEIIKESEVLVKKKKDKRDVTSDILIEKRKRLQEGTTYLSRIFETRYKTDESFEKLERVKSIVQNYTSKTTEQPKEFGDVSVILNDIKNNLFTEPKDAVKGEVTTSVAEVNKEVLDASLSIERAVKNLNEVSPEFNDYKEYMDDLTDIIEKVKSSNEPNKHDMVLDLIREKSFTNNRMAEILADFVSNLAKDSIESLTDKYNEELNELHEFGKLAQIESIVTNKLDEINELKENREKFKETVKSLTEQMSIATEVVNISLTRAHKYYLEGNKQIEKEYLDYANENNITLEIATVEKSDLVKSTIKENYGVVVRTVKDLINTSNNTVAKFMELVMKDEEIIEKQGDVIDLMMTHTTKRVISVDNLLQTKLEVIYGLDSSGKTVTGLALATAYSRYKKVLLIDLNLKQPSLRFYNKEEATTHNPDFFNEQTLSLDAFIKIPISNKMFEQLPYCDNMTIIQPLRPTTLSEYERNVNPKVFAKHVQMFLDSLARFYDRIIIILPENLEIFGDLLDKVGYLHIVRDFNPINIEKLTIALKSLPFNQKDIPIKNVIINKLSKGIVQTAESTVEELGLSFKDYSFVQIPLFQDVPSFKINGKNPYHNSITVRKHFDSLVKQLNF